MSDIRQMPYLDRIVGKVDRLVLVDEYGRAYEKWNVKVGLIFQDEGRTLKVFVSAPTRPA